MCVRLGYLAYDARIKYNRISMKYTNKRDVVSLRFPVWWQSLASPPGLIEDYSIVR